MERRRRRWWRWLLLAFAAWWLAGLGSALMATSARPAAITARDTFADRAVEPVTARAADDVELHGWLVRARPDSRHCIVLAAGAHGNRLAMLTRARWYLARGWSALVVDLRGTGTSTPTRISMGWHEAQDLHAWRKLLRWHGFAYIAAHGQSLGAAAIVYGDGDWDRVVLEALYRDIDSALHARLPWLPLPGLLLWPLRRCCELLTDIDANDLRPIDHIARLRRPTLLMAGEHDHKTGPAAAADLLAACGAAERRLATIAGAGHVDLLTHHRAAFEAALAAFIPDVRAAR